MQKGLGAQILCVALNQENIDRRLREQPADVKTKYREGAKSMIAPQPHSAVQRGGTRGGNKDKEVRLKSTLLVIQTALFALQLELQHHMSLI
eukprot:6207288-Pleurochrysis_carterae.AAC.3